MNETQLILIGLIAAAITWLLKMLAQRFGYHPSRKIVSVFLFFVSVLLALAWAGAVIPTLPPFTSDIAAYAAALWAYLNAWIAVGAPILGTATLIYNLLYERVVVPATIRVRKYFHK